jgi:AraC-like DNA-binding protein
LPDGTFELVIDLREDPRKLFDRQSPESYEAFRGGWFSGTHSQYIVIDAVPNSSMIGVHFRPGGAGAFLGFPAEELANRVVQFEAIWGKAGPRLREQLLATASARAKFLLLEQFLLERLARTKTAPQRQARVNWAVRQFLAQPEMPRIGALAAELGISHKHFITEFRREVGLTPKLFCRIQRFQRTLVAAQAGAKVDWADVACRCGYFDQAHFVHDFQAFSGLKPSVFVERRTAEPNYVPIA